MYQCVPLFFFSLPFSALHSFSVLSQCCSIGGLIPLAFTCFQRRRPRRETLVNIVFLSYLVMSIRPSLLLLFVLYAAAGYAILSTSGADTEEDEMLEMSLILAAGFILGQMGAAVSARMKKRRRRSFRRLRLGFEFVAAGYTENEFNTAFRMTRETFNKLVDLLRPSIFRKRTSAGSGLEGEILVGVFLRVMAGGDPHGVHRVFDIGYSIVNSVFKEVLYALLDVMPLPCIPSDVEQLKEHSIGFSSSRSRPGKEDNPLHGCVGAIDGVATEPDKPSDCDNPASFFSRKGFYCLAVQAVCDYDYRFLTYSMKCVGSTHDAVAFALFNVSRFLESGKLPCGFRIAGDEAYPSSDFLAIPFSQSQTISDTWKDAYNFHQSSLRMHIEQAFGFMENKWRIFRGSFSFDTDVNSKVICAAMILHNFCINNGEVAFNTARAKPASAIESSATEH